MNSTSTGSRTNVNNTAVAMPHFSSTDAIGNIGASDDDATCSALMIALATACDPSSGFSHLEHGWATARTKRSEKFTQTTVLARHGKKYRQALQKSIKKSSSFQKSMADDMNAMFRVANCRRKDEDEGAGALKVDHLDVDDLFKDALTNGMVTPQVTGDTNTHVGLNAPHRPGRHLALLSKYVSPEEMLSNINEADLHLSASPTTSGNACRTTLHSNCKLRPRSRTLERLKDQLSDNALQVPYIDTFDSTAASRSKSLPIYMCSSRASGSDSLKVTTEATCTSLSTPSLSLPYLKNQSVCKEEKSPQSSPPILPMSTLASSKKSTTRTSSRVVASNFSANENIAYTRPSCFLQRRNSCSSSKGLTRSFSALTLRRSTSTSTFKNATRNNLDRKNSTTNTKEVKKTSPSHPNMRRSASSKSSFRRRSSRGSFSSLRRHKVGIADIPAPTTGPGHNAVW